MVPKSHFALQAGLLVPGLLDLLYRMPLITNNLP